MNIKSTFKSVLTALLLLGLMVGSVAFATEKPSETEGIRDRNDVLTKTFAYQPERYQILNINNLWSWHREDGQANHSPTGDNGMFFPRGTSFVIYQDGLVWGSRAYLDAAHTQPAPFSQTIRVGGATYRTGQREGCNHRYLAGTGKVNNALAHRNVELAR